MKPVLYVCNVDENSVLNGNDYVNKILEVTKNEGAEVLVKTIACGVCHSDVHIHSGAFDLGGGNELPVPVPNPFTLGHENFW